MQGVAKKNYAKSILSVIVSRASSQVLSTVIGFKPSRISFQSTKVHYHSGRSYSTRSLKDYRTENFLYYRFSKISWQVITASGVYLPLISFLCKVLTSTEVTFIFTWIT